MTSIEKRRKRWRCWIGWHVWGMYTGPGGGGFVDRCIHCDKPRRKK